MLSKKIVAVVLIALVVVASATENKEAKEKNLRRYGICQMHRLLTTALWNTISVIRS